MINIEDSGSLHSNSIHIELLSQIILYMGEPSQIYILSSLSSWTTLSFTVLTGKIILRIVYLCYSISQPQIGLLLKGKLSSRH